MTLQLSELLKILSNTIGVSGYERAVSAVVRQHFAPYVDDFTEDIIGNLIMRKRGTGSTGNNPRRAIMLATHMDEIGAMVTHIDRGFVRIAMIGGLDVRILPAQEVVIFGRQTYDGVIASRPPHFADKDSSKFPPLAEYHVDLGLPPEVVAQNVRVGDVVAVKKSAGELAGSRITGKALDNRASVAALYVCLTELARLAHQWDVYAVATCQEEVDFQGATTSAYRLNPDAAIAIDVTFAEAPGVEDGNPTELGGGPSISVGANIHPVMAQRLKDTASALEMDIPLEPVPDHSGCDAWAIQTARDGIPTAILNVPLRYMHTPVEIVDLKDITRTGRLMAHFIAGLADDFVDQLIPTDGLEA